MPSWSASSPTRPCTPTRHWPAGSAAGMRSFPRSRTSAPARRPPRATWPRPASWPARTSRSPRRRPSWPRARARCEDKLRELLVPRDPNDGKDVILQVKAGEGGEESALFAGDLLRMYLRYAERQGWKTEVLDAERVRPRRLQGRDGGGQRGRSDAGVWRQLKYEGGVHRVQRVPVDRVAGPHPHQRGRRARAARGRGGRRQDRPGRPAHRRLPLVRARRAERQHHRLGGPDHPRADRHRRVAAEREEPAAEPGGRPAGAARPAARARRRRRRTRRRPTPAAPRSARSTAASGSAPTTSRRTGSPTTGSATRPTTSTRCSTATWTT